MHPWALGYIDYIPAWEPVVECLMRSMLSQHRLNQASSALRADDQLACLELVELVSATNVSPLYATVRPQQILTAVLITEKSNRPIANANSLRMLTNTESGRLSVRRIAGHQKGGC